VENEIHIFYCTGGKFREVVGVSLLDSAASDADPASGALWPSSARLNGALERPTGER